MKIPEEFGACFFNEVRLAAVDKEKGRALGWAG
jgi:hypothetical protein